MKVFKLANDLKKKILSLISEDDLDDDLKDKINAPSVSDTIQTITLSSNITLNKSDLTGNILFINTDDTTTRNLNIGTGFVANDKLTLIINWQNLGLIRLSIGGRNIWDVRGVILEFIFDGTYWRNLNNNTWIESNGISNTTILGERLDVGDSQDSVAIGRGKLSGDFCIFISHGAGGSTLNANNSIFIGGGTLGSYAILIGREINVAEDGIGLYGNAQTGGVAIGRTSNASVYGVALGLSSNNDNKDYAKAIGYRSISKYNGELGFRADNATVSSPTSTNSINHFRIVNWGIRTTNATPINLTVNNQTSRLSVATKHQLLITGEIHAMKSDYTDSKSWEFKALVARGTGSIVFIGTPTKSVLFASAGASSWDINLIANVTDNVMDIEVTGQASTTIFWKAIAQINEMNLA